MQLAEDHVGAVAAQHLGLRHRGHVAGLVLVAQDELAGLERRLVRVGAEDAGALDGRVADAVLEAEHVRGRPAARARPAARSGATPGRSRSGVAGERNSGLQAGRCPGASAATTRWTSCEPSGGSQCSGAFSPTSPSSAARAAMPCWNSGGKLASDSSGTPSALSPWKLSATASDTGRSGSKEAAESRCGISRRSSSRPACRSSMRRTGTCPRTECGRGIRAPAWMSSSSSATVDLVRHSSLLAYLADCKAQSLLGPRLIVGGAR